MAIQKYRNLLLILFCIALFSFSKIEAQIFEDFPLFGKIIFIDPGHGGRDPGAIVGTQYEKELNLQVSKILEDELIKKGATVYMTRYDDEDLSSQWDEKKKRGDLYRRILMFRKKDADIYLSIHMNYHSDTSLSGAEVLYNKINKENERLGTILMTNFQKNLNTTRELKQTELYMYKNTTVPGVLIECGFLSNYQELKNLQNEEYQKRLVNTITNSVVEYFS